MSGTFVTLPSHDGQQFDAYLALPPKGQGPGIVLIQEIWGVNAHIQAVADQYALDGYVVMAPDVFWRQQPRVNLAYDEAGTKMAYHYMQNLDGGNAVADLKTTAQALRARPELAGKIASVGFCMGGRLSFHLAATGTIDAAVCYYGGGIHSHLDTAHSIKVPILFHYAELDDHIPLSAVESVEKAFEDHADAEIHVYPGVRHGFNCWGRPAFNQRAAALARGRTLEWLATRLE